MPLADESVSHVPQGVVRNGWGEGFVWECRSAERRMPLLLELSSLLRRLMCVAEWQKWRKAFYNVRSRSTTFCALWASLSRSFILAEIDQRYRSSSLGRGIDQELPGESIQTLRGNFAEFMDLRSLWWTGFIPGFVVVSRFPLARRRRKS
jgi:hypothetical protein